MNENALNVNSISRIGIEAEFGKDLTYDEAAGLVLQKFSSLWKADFRNKEADRPKQIIFVKELI
ncbi:MAG: hypothetical protein JRN15_09090 [Nitrososphaerota archaeon]|nr:hypothetical protein [Nitrososphaerota archaeon]